MAVHQQPNTDLIRAFVDVAHAGGMALRTHEISGGTVHTVIDPLCVQVAYVTGYSCDCAMFVLLGSCPHHALLLSEFDWIPAAAVL